MTSTYEDNEMILNDDEDITISTSDESHERKRMAADFFREQSEVRTKIAEQQAIPMFTMDVNVQQKKPWATIWKEVGDFKRSWGTSVGR